MGNEKRLQSVAEKIKSIVKIAEAVEVVGVDIECEDEAAFDEAVDKASRILDNLDALVHCYAYEGMFIVWLIRT